MADYGGFTFEMPQQEYDIYSPYTADVEQWQPSEDWMQDWTSMADYTDPYESGAAFQSMYNEQPVAPSATYDFPQQPTFDPSLAPEYTDPGTKYVPPSFSESAAPSVGQGGRGVLANEDDWWSKIAKAGMGMAVGAGTSALGSLANKAISGSGSERPQPTAAPAAAVAPLTAPAAQQYTPEALEPRPGTKASPLISGRPTGVRGSSGLKERKPSYGGFSMY